MNTRDEEEARDELFRVTHMITACRSGEIYGRRKLRRYVVGKLRRSYWQYLEGYESSRVPQIVDLYLDDPAWIGSRHGCVPHSIFRDIQERWHPSLFEDPPTRDY
jgi:hypothetical protein